MKLQMLTNCAWRLATDPENIGRDKKWFNQVPPQTRAVPVPGIIQQVFPGYHGVAWYWLAFQPDLAPVDNERVLLRFGAVDYLAEVWLNGQPVGGHEGGETPFDLDVTGAFKAGRENLLAVRVLNPTETPIDGIKLSQTPHLQKGNSGCGCDFNTGGIVLPVELIVAPPVRITDVFAAPDIHSGEVRLHVTIRNDTGATVNGTLSLAISPDKTSDIVIDTEIQLDLAAGESTRDVPLTIPRPHLWDLDDPFLYRIHAVLNAPARHTHSVRFGFREMRVVGGYFHLNGRRIFLRSMHTAPFFPVVQLGCPDPALMRRDMIFAKACGFNCVRFISKMPMPGQLDIADEIGIMVYDESYAAWWHLGGFNQQAAAVEGQEQVEQRFAAAIREMILRDRNHPSITIWGLLNEVPPGLIAELAIASLPLIRSLDQTRLVLLHSGRWDKRMDIGSLSNPGSNEWEYEWGAEAKNVKSETGFGSPEYFATGGDIHYYPDYPISSESSARIRNLGVKTRPVFLSEGGIGSALNAIAELKKYDEQPGLLPNLEDREFLRKIVENFEADWKRFGMQGVYPFAEDMLRESQRLHGNQRRRWLDIVRANPGLCGHSMTSMLDGTSGEGIWSFWREFKPGIVDVMRDGWAPLRWCLFVNPLHGYTNRPIEIEAVLANEDVLKPGSYPVTFRIWGKQGMVWEKRVRLHLPAKGKSGQPPLAVPVLKTSVRLNVPPGEYVFAASLDQGGAPRGDRRTFRLSAAAELPRLKGVVTIWGLDKKAQQWLEHQGLRTQPLKKKSAAQPEVILVGSPEDASDTAQWELLMRRVAAGAWVVFLEPASTGGTRWLPLKKKGRWTCVFDWLYHKEAVAKNHPLFDGLPAPGILDWDYYDEVAGRHMLFDGETPATTIVAGFAAGLSQLEGWNGPQASKTYNAGVLVGEYRFGDGHFVLNGLPLLAHLDRHPAADRLLLNFIAYGLTKKKAHGAQSKASVKEYFTTLLAAVAPPADGVFTLLPRDCRLHSPQVGTPRLLTNPDGSDRIGMWHEVKAKAVWRIQPRKPGAYRVLIEQACDPTTAGSHYTLRVGKTKISTTAQPTKGWFNYIEVDLGIVTLPAGLSEVELASTRLQDPTSFMDVQRIRLVPVPKS